MTVSPQNDSFVDAIVDRLEVHSLFGYMIELRQVDSYYQKAIGVKSNVSCFLSLMTIGSVCNQVLMILD